MKNDLFLRPCGYRRKRRGVLLDVLVLVAFAALAIAPHCRRCGSWWNPQHGSRPEGDAGVNRVVMKYERLSLADARGEKTGRNDLCVCGSGVKFKKCCGGARKV